MKAIILAAGMGVRLRPFTQEIPKCLIEINGKTILERIIENCVPFDITRFVVVVGHKKETIFTAASKLEGGHPVEFSFVENMDYQTTNTGVSLVLALDSIKEDVVIINGDDVFEKQIMRKLLESNTSSIVIDNRKVLVQESFKVKTSDRLIELMGKDIPIDQATGEFIGISLIKLKDLDVFKTILNKKIRQNKKTYYDFIFQEFAESGSLSFTFTDGLNWTEIDTEEDLLYAQKILEGESFVK
jgi:choline kinase